MRFARVRSGLAESVEEATVVAIGREGNILYSSGTPEAPLFYRSAIKPFQAMAAQKAGLSLPDEHLAVTCSSHGGWPVHVALVRKILSDHGLTEDDLLCPSGSPFLSSAGDFHRERGRTGYSKVLHNCSGKHAGWLAACVVAGWDTKSYLDADHPLQLSILGIMEEVSGLDPTPVGVDGCGAPTLRGSVHSLAKAFLELGTNEEYKTISHAMSRFSALVADNLRPDGRVGSWWTGPQKYGAEGLFAMSGSDVAIVAKSHSGRPAVAVAAALAAVERIGVMPPSAAQALADERQPPVLGAGMKVGQLELVEA